MLTSVTTDHLSSAVMAVPPLARDAEGNFSDADNAAVIRHLEQGGVSTILYGGNALAHHWPMSLYADWLDRLAALAAEDTWLLPSVGSDGGKLIDQAEILKERKFPAALLLPLIAPRTREGTLTALRRFHQTCGVKLIIYIKTDGYMPAEDIALLHREGVVLGVKYAVPRQAGENDPYLQAIIEAIGAKAIISGFGEPPAIPHMLEYGLAGFTAGCVCIAPAMSTAILDALKSGQRARAEELLEPMLPLEKLRGEINEIRVLHEAITLSGLANCGPVLPTSSSVPDEARAAIRAAALQLLKAEEAFRLSRAA